jgi:hypothetical protein
MEDGAARIAYQDLFQCKTSDMKMGRTCSFDGHQLVFEVCLYLLNTAELMQ